MVRRKPKPPSPFDGRWRLTTQDGHPCVVWTWEGNDEMDPASGRGWAVLKGDELHGTLYFHQGDESGFVARRVSGTGA